MSDRFFVELPITGDSATLTGQEAVHLTKVLRARIGDVVVLFDGSGVEFSARVAHVEKNAVHCAILEPRRIDRELTPWVALGVALPKGDRQRVLVEKLTELGAASLTPLITARSVVQPDEQTVVRLRRSVIEASKQCGRNRLMMIGSPLKLSEFLAAPAPNVLHVIAHPSLAAGGSRSLTELSGSSWKNVIIAVGPEGGFTDGEVEQAVGAGWLPIDLGPRMLRVDTAAIALAAVAGMAREWITQNKDQPR